MTNPLQKTTFAVPDPASPTAVAVPVADTPDIVAVPVPGPPGRAGTSGAGVLFTQATPATVWTINHNIGRSPISVTVYSLDYEVQWDEYVVGLVSDDVCHITFDDPTSGVALIL